MPRIHEHQEMKLPLYRQDKFCNFCNCKISRSPYEIKNGQTARRIYCSKECRVLGMGGRFLKTRRENVPSLPNIKIEKNDTAMLFLISKSQPIVK